MPQDYVLEKYIAKLGLKLLVGLLLLGIGSFLTDYVVWRIRVANGGGLDTVSVSRIEVVPLKGKTMSYPVGLEDAPCSRSLYPQSGAGACWWLRRYPEIYVNY